MSTVIETLEKKELKPRPSFAAGDRVRVHFQVIEGNRQGSGARETFTVRKNSFGVGVERTFPLHSPKIEQLEVAARGDVRRAKLYYLRDKVGKQARVAERRWGIEDDLVVASDEAEAVDAEGVAQDEAEPAVVEAEPAEGEEGPAAEPAEGEEDPAQAPEGEAGQAPEAEAAGSDEAEPGDAPEADAGDEEASSEKAEG